MIITKKIHEHSEMKYISIIRDYARKGDSMPPLEALRHITHLYMEQCGVSIILRTAIYESGEYWLNRLVDSSVAFG